MKEEMTFTPICRQIYELMKEKDMNPSDILATLMGMCSVLTYHLGIPLEQAQKTALLAIEISYKITKKAIEERK